MTQVLGLSPPSHRYVPMEALQAGIRTWEEPIAEVGGTVLWASVQSFTDETQGCGVWAPPDQLSAALNTLHQRAVEIVEVPASLSG